MIKLFNRYPNTVFYVTLVLALSPLITYFALWQTERLGPNPYQVLLDSSGFWAMFFLIVTIGITPLRRWFRYLSQKLSLSYGKRLSDWNFMFRLRKSLGNYCFLYLCCHAAIYAHFDLGWSGQFFIMDFQEKQFLQFGFIAWIVCALLAITSFNPIRKAMGKSWRPLHRTIYALCILAVLHIFLSEKVGEYQSIIFGALAATLLLHRILAYAIPALRRRDDNGLEHHR